MGDCPNARTRWKGTPRRCAGGRIRRFHLAIIPRARLPARPPQLPALSDPLFRAAVGQRDHAAVLTFAGHQSAARRRVWLSLGEQAPGAALSSDPGASVLAS